MDSHRRALNTKAQAAATFGALSLVGVFAGAQAAVPVRQLTTAEVVSTEKVNMPNGMRELSNGEILVNDAGNRRVIVFDKSLATFRVVADSSVKTRNMYGKRPTLIIPYAGDSTLLVDVGTRSFLVLSPAGTVTRVMSPPRPNDVGFMAGAGLGQPAFDQTGRLVYRTVILPAFKPPVAGKPFETPTMPDSSPILRGDFNTRTADTLAWVRIPKMRLTTTPIAGGGVSISPVVNPLANIDDWTLLPDGTLAVLRGQDYHMEWYSPDGRKESSPKMPFDWKRLTDEEKNAIIDSTKKEVAKLAVVQDATTAGAGGHGAPPARAGGGGHGMTIMPITPGDGSPAPQAAMGASPSIPAVPDVVPASDLPDYMPPVLRSGLMKADMEGNVWVLPSTSSQSGGGLLYDVINRKGEVFQRVRLPLGRALAGFGDKGAIYLAAYNNGVAVLERVRLQQTTKSFN